MKHIDEKTNAIRLLEQKKLKFTTHNYVNSGAISGIEVAQALNENPDIVFKTLVTVGEKNVSMLKSKDLLPLTGYIHGGCSPIGMKKPFKTVIDASAQNYGTINFSGGKIGYQIEISLDELKKALNFKLEEITVES